MESYIVIKNMNNWIDPEILPPEEKNVRIM